MNATEIEETADQAELETEVTDRLLRVARSIADDGEGALFVIAEPDRIREHLDLHYPQVDYDGRVTDDGFDEVLKQLATLDGAVAVSPDGKLLAYGARVTKQATLRGFGTRHSAAKGYTRHDGDATAILTSEETGWTKVFQDGEKVLEIDPADVEPSTLRKLSRWVVTKDAAILGAAGISAATLGLGSVGLLVLGGSYVVVRGAMETVNGWLGDETR